MLIGLDTIRSIKKQIQKQINDSIHGSLKTRIISPKSDRQVDVTLSGVLQDIEESGK